jgi:hypothetical protein
MEQVTSNSFRRRAIVICLNLSLGLGFPSFCQAAGEPTEYQVKAAFLLNFTKFIEWPAAAFETPAAPIAICILGDDPFGSALDQFVAGEVVNGRKVTVERIKHAPPPKACQVLFTARSEKDAARSLLGLGMGTLTVGESEAFVRDGGMIAFVVEDRRVRFEINQTAAQSAGLKLSSRLLNVAKSVE